MNRYLLSFDGSKTLQYRIGKVKSTKYLAFRCNYLIIFKLYYLYIFIIYSAPI